MKKWISVLLAVLLIGNLQVAAFAGETGVGAGSYDAEVTGTYVPGTSGGIVFSVDITWESMNFTYHAEKEPVWDPANHTYSETEAAYWEGRSIITVTNHSNTAIQVVPAYKAVSGYEDAYVDFSNYRERIASAESGSAQTGYITVTPAGALPANTENQKIGTITLTVDQIKDVTADDAEDLQGDISTLITTIDANALYDRIDQDELSALRTADAILNNTLNDYQQGNADQEDLNSAYDSAYDYYTVMRMQVDSLLN